MGTLGFWRLAQADPDWIAAVDPDGTPHRAGDLLARADRLVHALRVLGMETGDGLCGLVPNGSDGLVLYLAALQAGWYYTPVNWHLTGPEIGHIVADSEARAFFVHERFAAEGTRGAAASGIDPSRVFALGDVPGRARSPTWSPGIPPPPRPAVRRAPPCTTPPAPPAGPRASAGR